MASSPDSIDGDTDEYAAGWQRLQTLLREGQSWSGNERHCVFLNTGTPTFADASAVTGLDFADDGRGMATVDWDHDGDLDLWFSNRTGPRVRFLRNNNPSKNSSVAFKLKAVGQNLDAIGAQVELFFIGEDEERHVRTLKAGSGFISQSSKWVHFGVPEGREVSHVIVRWPAGGSSEHQGLGGATHWVITEGVSAPEAWSAPARTLQLTEGPLAKAAKPATARIPIIHPLPLLGLTYDTAEEIDRPIQAGRDKGVLITLWADWCVNCKRELAALVKEHEELERAGLRVLAINVDEADERVAASAFLDQISWPYERGLANETLLDVLSVAQRVLLDLPQADALPTSYLLDGEGRLQVIYRGPASGEQILKDIGLFDSSPIERRAVTARFEGWWSSEQIPTRYATMAIKLRHRGHADLAAEYLKRISIKGDAENAPQFAVERMFGTDVNTGVELMKSGENRSAIEAFRRAIALKPENATVNKLLGVCLQRVGEVAEAKRHLEVAVAQAPNDAEAKNDLGMALINLGEMEPAAAQFRAAIETDPSLAKPHYNLGIYHARTSDLDLAEELIAEAVRLSPEYPRAWAALGRIYSMKGNTTAALPTLERALEQTPSSPDVILLYAEALIEGGRREDARALLPKLESLDPARAETLKSLLGG